MSIGETKKKEKKLQLYPKCSMYVLFTYIWHNFMVNVGKHSIHGEYGYVGPMNFLCSKATLSTFVLPLQSSFFFPFYMFYHLPFLFSFLAFSSKLILATVKFASRF